MPAVDLTQDERPVAVILTAIPDEIDAVLRHLQNVDEVVYRNRFVFDCGDFDGGLTSWRVVVAECGPGNVPAALVVDNAVERFDPDVVIFVGVAGGLKDVHLGDVVASSKIYGFHSGKAGEKFQVRPLLEWADLSLEQRARAVRRRGNWPARIRLDPSHGAQPPRAFVGPIAAGENVVSSEKSDAHAFLRDNYSDALAVEMEGYGFLSAARYCALPGLVVRAISDLCQGKQQADDAGWQPRAAAHAAAFAFEILANHQPPPRLRSRLTRRPPSDDNGTRPANGQTAGKRGDGDGPAKKDLPTASTPSWSTKRASLDDIVRSFERASTSLIRLAVNPAHWLTRPEESELRRLYDDRKGRVLCVLGGPGTGKTSLLAKLAQDAAASGMPVLGIKADLIPPDETFKSWSVGQLGIGLSMADAVKAIASDRPVVVLIDQLDALASLVDLTSSRLNDIVDFVTTCATLPTVSVVCSCRAFEYYHDTRFRGIDAECVNLELPAWEQVAEELKQQGINEAESWPLSFREILRTPQHLEIYLQRYRDTGAMNVVDSYQAMLDDLWNRTLKDSKDRDFVYRLAAYLVDKESLWAPIVQFESDMALIEKLERVDVVRTHGPQFGFRHQTLLEHAKARLFTKTGRSLCDYVLERQTAILVRPTLWAVLRYLREADPTKYRKELDHLMASDLRLHIRYLLIDFLSQVTDPEDFEVVHMTDRLKVTEDRLRVLIAIRGKEDWFRALRDAVLPMVMSWRPQEQWPMIGLISDAWKFAREECLQLIEDYWLSDPGKDALTWQALRDIGQWDQRSVDMMCKVIRRSGGDEDRLWWAEDIVYRVSADKPELAPQVFLAVVERADTRDGGSAASEEFDTRHGRSPLDSTNVWYKLPEVATAAPVEFLRIAWPWFARTAIWHHRGRPSSVVFEYGGHFSALDRDEGDLECPVTTAFLTAVVETAKAEPHLFIEITRNSRSVDNLPVQRMLSRGFAAVAAQHPELAFEFLSEDPRRFTLRDFASDEESDTVGLIAAIATHWDDEGRASLEAAIRSWTQYRPGTEMDDYRRTHDREARLRLLMAIPRTLMTPELAAFVEHEQRELPDWNRTRRRGRFGTVREIPPMTREQMETAPDDDVLESLRGPQHHDRSTIEWKEVEGGWEEPGGAWASTKELGELAKTNRARVLPLLPKLMAEGNESPAAHVLHTFVETDLPAQEAYDLVRTLAAFEPESDDFRSDAAYLLYNRCRQTSGLPDDLCVLLEDWLAMPWTAESPFATSDKKEEAPDEAERDLASVLWGHRGGLLDTDKAFFPLLAATNGYLMRTPPETAKWLSLIDRLLDQSIAEGTWLNYCLELRWIRLKGCNREKGIAVIRKLFDRYPPVKFSVEGCRLIAMVSDLMPEEAVRGFLDDLIASRDFQHQQAFGEVLAVIALRKDAHQWTRPVLERQLTEIASDATGKEGVATGIAFAAAHLWDEPEARPEAGQLLCRLMPHVTDRVAEAIGTLFWTAEDFPADEHTDALLHAFAANPQVLSGRNVPDLIELLAKLLPHSRRNVLNVCQAIVKTRGEELRSISHSLFISGPHLVNIAMTLQRFSDTRGDGLSLLEDLLRLGLDDAFAILHDIDIRPASVRTREPRRRRRRRKVG